MQIVKISNVEAYHIVMYHFYYYNMNQQLINTILEAGNTIVKNTTDDDVLIFIGQSPNLIYHVVKKYRESYELPFSGTYLWCGEMTIKCKKEKLDFFKKIAEHYKITKGVIT